MKELLPDADPGFSLDTSDIEVLSKEIVGYLIHPLCALFKLPVTEGLVLDSP